MGFFDTRDTGELNTRMFEDVKKISNGLGEKVGVTIQAGSQFIAGMIVAFYYGWKLALVVLAALPPIAITGYLWFYTTTGQLSSLIFLEKKLLSPTMLF